jgi:sulfite exporter TauE/SafE
MTILITALLLGLMGSFHCLGMCGPIAFVLPVDRNNKAKMSIQTLLYHLGRMTAYAAIGFVFGYVGKGISLIGFQQKISLVMGIIMLVLAFVPTTKVLRLKPFSFWNKFVYFIKTYLGNYLEKRSTLGFYVIGFFNGLLPCGLVYIALVGAMATGSPVLGALYMAIFGLGTAPMMTLAIYLGNFVSVKMRNKINKLIPYAVAVVGILFILRGLNLGIMFISPSDKMLNTDGKMIKMKYNKKINKINKVLPEK